MDYLNSNPLISDKSGWNKIKLYKKEKQNYINQYIFFAKTYVSFFQSYQSNSTPEKNNISNTSIPFETNYSNEIQLSLYQSSNNDNSNQNSWLMLIIILVWNINVLMLFYVVKLIFKKNINFA